VRFRRADDPPNADVLQLTVTSPHPPSPLSLPFPLCASLQSRPGLMSTEDWASPLLLELPGPFICCLRLNAHRLSSRHHNQCCDSNPSTVAFWTPLPQNCQVSWHTGTRALRASVPLSPSSSSPQPGPHIPKAPRSRSTVSNGPCPALPSALCASHECAWPRPPSLPLPTPQPCPALPCPALPLHSPHILLLPVHCFLGGSVRGP